MQYFLSVIDQADPEATEPRPGDGEGTATDDEMAAINAFNQDLRDRGQWVFAAGLGSPDTATVVDGRGQEPVFTDGPFVETKEYVAGFWVVEADDLDVALRIAAQGSQACRRRVEVRPFL